MELKVSVAMCTYNGSKYIKDQIVSILNQSHVPDEIVICDDNSTDNTIGLACKILNKTSVNWKIIKNCNTLGVTKNFEKAISLCQGDVIFTSDQDDFWAINKIERILEEFDNNPNCNFVFSNAEIVNSDLKKSPVDLWSTIGFSIDSLDENTEIFELLLKKNFVTGATMAFRREFIGITFPFSSLWIHDYWIAINLSTVGQSIAIPDKLILYRQHDENIIGAKRKSFLKNARISLLGIFNNDIYREKKYLMVKDFREFIVNKNIDNRLKEKVINCELFWKNRLELHNQNRREAIRYFLSDLKRGNYERYYSGFQGFIKDVTMLVFLKK